MFLSETVVPCQESQCTIPLRTECTCGPCEQDGLTMADSSIQQEGIAGHVLGGHNDVGETGTLRDLCRAQRALPGHPASILLAQSPVIDSTVLGQWLARQLRHILNNNVRLSISLKHAMATASCLLHALAHPEHQLPHQLLHQRMHVKLCKGAQPPLSWLSGQSSPQHLGGSGFPASFGTSCPTSNYASVSFWSMQWPQRYAHHLL